MIYILDDKAGDSSLHIKGELYKYLIKVRRHKIGDKIVFRNNTDRVVEHSYILETISPREVIFTLLNSTTKEVKPARYLHVGWCVVDTKTVEKTLPMLNELGVSKISFVYCNRSQKHFKPDFNRFTRILQSSSAQCGRTDSMTLEIVNNLEEFISQYPDCVVFDFCDNVLQDDKDFKTVLIGCEGGFTQGEKKILLNQQRYRLDIPMILRSETAVVSIATKSLL